MDVDEIRAAAAQPVAQQRSPAAAGAPTLRERWRRTMLFQRVDRRPNFEFGYWASTLQAWHAQGLPSEVRDQRSAYAYFGIENWSTLWADCVGPMPAFPEEVLSDDGRIRTWRDRDGVVARINVVGDRSIPEFVGFPIHDRASWEAYRQRLRPDPARLPAGWRDAIGNPAGRERPLAIGFGSLMGVPRNWIGFENIALMTYDDPGLLEDIVETLCELICATIAPMLKEIEFDFAIGWEDICFNSGPILGVDFIRSVVVPRYRRITDLLHRHGCHIAWTDCDGDVTPIVDCFRAGGLDCLFPVEVHAGSDPVAIRQRWPDIRLQGGVDKMILLKDRAAVRAEIERLRPEVAAGGFLPGIDHRVQSDASLDLYKYYLKLKRDLLGCGGEPQYDESQL